MLKKTVAALVCAVVAGTAVAAEVFDKPFEKPGDAVKYRQSAFQLIKENYSPLGAMLRGKSEFDPALAKQLADNVATLAPFAAHGFNHNYMNSDSGALEKIWDNKADFDRLMQDFVDASGELKVAAAGGDLKALQKPFKAVAGTCKACHKKYRD